LTGRTSACESSGANTMALHVPRHEIFDHLDLLHAIVFSQRPLPDDFDLCSVGRQLTLAFTAPALIDFQNSCVVPLGTTAMV